MLTQAEIDALLSGAIEIEAADTQDSVNLAELLGKQEGTASPSVGASARETAGPASTDERQIRPYNFWSPDRFSKEQMRAVELVHEELGERLTNTLPSFLRTNLRPRIVHTEQGRFHDFMADLPPNSLFHLVSLAPLPGQLLITISPEVSYIILETRLGGRSDRRSKEHTLTDIDQSLLQDLIENMLNDLKASWSKVVAVEPKLVDSTINQHWVQMMIGNERVMMITFELMVHDVTGTMSFYVPYAMLKPIINELNPHIIISGRKEQKPDPNSRKNNYEGLSKTNMPLRVMLGNTQITMGELMNLRKGDVLLLDTPIVNDVPVMLSDQVRFKGRIGRKGKYLAVQLTEIIKTEDETKS
jgi:flagellar motor switch protein FliM